MTKPETIARRIRSRVVASMDAAAHAASENQTLNDGPSEASDSHGKLGLGKPDGREVAQDGGLLTEAGW